MTDKEPTERVEVTQDRCPFCGGEAYIDPNSAGLIGEDWPRVRCYNCDATGPASDVMNDAAPAIAAWNTRHGKDRHQSAPTGEASERARELLAETMSVKHHKGPGVSERVVAGVRSGTSDNRAVTIKVALRAIERALASAPTLPADTRKRRAVEMAEMAFETARASDATIVVLTQPNGDWTVHNAETSTEMLSRIRRFTPTPSLAPLVAELEGLLERANALPWAYRPEKYDDWGTVRGAPDAEGLRWTICRARDPRVREADLSAHRSAGTDPWESTARLIVAAVNALPRLLAALKETRHG